LSIANQLQENPGASACQEVPAASIYQCDLRESQLCSHNLAQLLKDANFICIFSVWFKANQRKEMHI